MKEKKKHFHSNDKKRKSISIQMKKKRKSISIQMKKKEKAFPFK